MICVLAIKKSLPIDNAPLASQRPLGSVRVLEPTRAKFDKPITITSGYRSEALCEAIGSRKTSQHAAQRAPKIIDGIARGVIFVPRASPKDHRSLKNKT